jgi:hypothetical protein
MKKPAKPARRKNQPAAAIPDKTPFPPKDNARSAGRSTFPR